MCYVYVYNSDLSFDYFWKVVFGKIKIRNVKILFCFLIKWNLNNYKVKLVVVYDSWGEVNFL